VPLATVQVDGSPLTGGTSRFPPPAAPSPNYVVRIARPQPIATIRQIPLTDFIDEPMIDAPFIHCTSTRPRMGDLFRILPELQAAL
jgi:hypothetical protein